MPTAALLAINTGSSSLKYKVYDLATLNVLAQGHIKNMASSALEGALAKVVDAARPYTLKAIAHRVVHGGETYVKPTLLTPKTMAALHALDPLAPLHQPHNLSGAKVCGALWPNVPQYAVFDTAFHRRRPAIANVFALPQKWREAGVQRYGFHGLSYAYMAQTVAAKGRVLVAHLGSGASMCAMKDGVAVDSSMGFSALDGLVMSTRCGNIDPAVVLYLMQHGGLSADEVNTLLYTESGLKGLSGTTGDMQKLEADPSPAAAFAVDVFIYRAVREAGGLIATMGGVDTIVFTAGIGMGSARVRAGISAGLAHLGVVVDDVANANMPKAGGPFHGAASKVCLYAHPTDEEMMMAQDVRAVLNNNL